MLLQIGPCLPATICTWFCDYKLLCLMGITSWWLQDVLCQADHSHSQHDIYGEFLSDSVTHLQFYLTLSQAHSLIWLSLAPTTVLSSYSVLQQQLYWIIWSTKLGFLGFLPVVLAIYIVFKEGYTNQLNYTRIESFYPPF